MPNSNLAEAPVERLKLQASDDVVVTVDRDVACKSVLIKTMLEDLDDGSEQEMVITLNDCKGAILEKIIQYCSLKRHVVYVPRDGLIDLTAEDEEFLNVSYEERLEILKCAHYLEIPEIVDIVSQKIVNSTKGKSPEELREIFGLEDDLSEEEKKQIKERFSWASDYQM